MRLIDRRPPSHKSVNVKLDTVTTGSTFSGSIRNTNGVFPNQVWFRVGSGAVSLTDPRVCVRLKRPSTTVIMDYRPLEAEVIVNHQSK